MYLSLAAPSLCAPSATSLCRDRKSRTDVITESRWLFLTVNVKKQHDLAYTLYVVLYIFLIVSLKDLRTVFLTLINIAFNFL